jgi:predicted transposase YdaD
LDFDLIIGYGLNWSTLKLLEGSFVDEDLRGSEADLLYEIEHVLGEESVWVYILLEHQSTPDRWMRFRLLSAPLWRHVRVRLRRQSRRRT